MQPNLYLRLNPTETERRVFWEGYAHQANYVTHVHLQSFDRIKELKKSQQNLMLVDSNVFVENSPEFIFGDYCHMSVEGYEQVAEGLADVITSALHRQK